MRIEIANSGEAFLVPCNEHEDTDEAIYYWWHLNTRRGEKIAEISHGLCFDCFKVLYGDLFTEDEIVDLYKKGV